MRQTVVGVFDRHETARDAIDALSRSGFDRTRIHVTESHPNATASVAASPPRDDDSVLGHLRSFFAELFGTEHEVRRYAETVRGGGAIVKVDVDDQSQAPRAELALVSAGAVDITHRTNDGSEPADPSTPDDFLRAAAADTLSTAEVSDSAFERYDAAFRADYQTRYSPLGGAYESYRPAYRYGHELRADTRYHDRPWDEVEPDLRNGWDAAHPGTVWDDVQAAIRHAWERVAD